VGELVLMVMVMVEVLLPVAGVQLIVGVGVALLVSVTENVGLDDATGVWVLVLVAVPAGLRVTVGDHCQGSRGTL